MPQSKTLLIIHELSFLRLCYIKRFHLASRSEQSYYRWRREYGGMEVAQAQRLKDLEKENARLKRLLADAELDKAILNEALTGKY